MDDERKECNLNNSLDRIVHSGLDRNGPSSVYDAKSVFSMIHQFHLVLIDYMLYHFMEDCV